MKRIRGKDIFLSIIPTNVISKNYGITAYLFVKKDMYSGNVY